MQSNKLKISLVITAIVVAGLIGLSFWESETPVIQDFSPTQNEITQVPQNTAALVVDFSGGDTRTYQLNLTGEENLLELMQDKFEKEGVEFAYKSYSGLGSLVTNIGGKENGVTDEYWQFWVNGNYSQVGASSYIVKPNDVIEWKFTGQTE